MFVKIEDEKTETFPVKNQPIAFKSGGITFAGFYLGDKKASPFSMKENTPPVFCIEEWMPIQLWA